MECEELEVELRQSKRSIVVVVTNRDRIRIKQELLRWEEGHLRNVIHLRITLAELIQQNLRVVG